MCSSIISLIKSEEGDEGAWAIDSIPFPDFIPLHSISFPIRLARPSGLTSLDCFFGRMRRSEGALLSINGFTFSGLSLRQIGRKVNALLSKILFPARVQSIIFKRMGFTNYFGLTHSTFYGT